MTRSFALGAPVPHAEPGVSGANIVCGIKWRFVIAKGLDLILAGDAEPPSFVRFRMNPERADR